MLALASGTHAMSNMCRLCCQRGMGDARYNVAPACCCGLSKNSPPKKAPNEFAHALADSPRARGRFVSAELIVSQNTSCHSEGLALLENIVAEPAQTTESQALEIRPLSGTVLMAAISGNFARSRFDFPSEATSQPPPSKPQANKHMNEHNILKYHISIFWSLA